MSENNDIIEGIIKSVSDSCKRLFKGEKNESENFPDIIKGIQHVIANECLEAQSDSPGTFNSTIMAIEEIRDKSIIAEQRLIVDACEKILAEIDRAQSQDQVIKSLTKFTQWLDFTLESIEFEQDVEVETQNDQSETKRSLIVEDDEAVRETIKSFLEDDFDCDCVPSGKDAILHFLESISKNERYDLVLLDIMMPEMNGIEVLQKMRDIETMNRIGGLDRTKIIMVTALDDRKAIFGSFNTGCEGYVIKPFDREKLFVELRKLQLVSS